MGILKDNVTISVFNYIENDTIENKNKAIECISLLAKKYKVVMKKRIKLDVKEAFRDFIENKQGYNNTLPNLKSSL